MKSKLWQSVLVLTLSLFCLNTAYSQKVVEWRMDESSGSIVDDSTINENDGYAFVRLDLVNYGVFIDCSYASICRCCDHVIDR